MGAWAASNPWCRNGFEVRPKVKFANHLLWVLNSVLVTPEQRNQYFKACLRAHLSEVWATSHITHLSLVVMSCE